MGSMERARERGKSERSLPLGQSHHPNGRALPTEFPPMGPKRGSIHETPLSGAGPPGDLAEILLVPPPAPSSRTQSWGGGQPTHPSRYSPGRPPGQASEMETQPHTHWEPRGRAGHPPTGWSQAEQEGRTGTVLTWTLTSSSCGPARWGGGVRNPPPTPLRAGPLSGRPGGNAMGLTAQRILGVQAGPAVQKWVRTLGPGAADHSPHAESRFCAAHEPE